MIATPQLLNLDATENGFAVDSVSGTSYQISDLGLEVITWIKNGDPLEEFPARIGEACDVDQHTAERDLTDFLGNLRTLDYSKVRSVASKISVKMIL